jgi:hypothetical protein
MNAFKRNPRHIAGDFSLTVVHLLFLGRRCGSSTGLTRASRSRERRHLFECVAKGKRRSSNTYWGFLIENCFIVYPAQAMPAEFIATFKDFPPAQKAIECVGFVLVASVSHNYAGDSETELVSICAGAVKGSNLLNGDSGSRSP